MPQEFILRENVLTVNTLVLPNKGKIFKGGYIGIVKEYTYSSPWSDKESIKKFRSKERLESYLKTNYPMEIWEIEYENEWSV